MLLTREERELVQKTFVGSHTSSLFAIPDSTLEPRFNRSREKLRRIVFLAFDDGGFMMEFSYRLVCYLALVCFSNISRRLGFLMVCLRCTFFVL